MGAGGSKAHEAFAVQPAAAAPAAGTPDPAAAALPAPAQEALATLAGLTDSTSDDPAAAYAALTQASQQALQALQGTDPSGIPADVAAAGLAEVKAATQEWLTALPPEQLQQLAAQQGFEHPTLVGLHGGDGAAHPLAHWLDPAYPDSSPSKLAIQHKAAERYAQLAAGDTIDGLTYADVQAAEAGLGLVPPPPSGAWSATPAQVAGALADLNTAAAAATLGPGLPGQGGDHGAGDLLAAERHVFAAHCPEMGAELDKVKASAKALVDKQLAGLTGSKKGTVVGQLVADAQADGTISGDQARLLSRDQQLALLRASTPAGERAGLQELAAGRAAQLAAVAAAKQELDSHGLAALGPAASPEQVQAFATAAGAYHAAWKQASSWAGTVADHKALDAVTGATLAGGYWAQGASAAQLTQEFRAWAKGQKLADLKAAAGALGMATDGASRAQVQNYLAASWDATLDKAGIQAAVTAAKTAKAAAKQTPAASSGPSLGGQQPKTVTGPPPAPPAVASFAAKHREVVQALKAHQALAADLPARPAQAEVAAWEFGPGTAAHLGGAHAKTLHTAPDGSAWLFKPDHAAKGARAHAEAAAGEILHRAGIPGVGVYVTRLNGQVGAVQPLVAGASTLSADAKSWSQADADALVGYHVGAWAIGDHDGSAANILRTPSGAICPVDHGQAFKYFGADRLDVDFHPNASYGAPAPAFHQLYKAAKAGGLAAGVQVRPEAALPVIRAFECIPDQQYRSMLAATASHGVKHGAHWVPAMRKAAQKRLGTTKVSDAQVAEEFLTQAVERKQGLRGAFRAFFADLGFASAAKLEKVA